MLNGMLTRGFFTSPATSTMEITPAQEKVAMAITVMNGPVPLAKTGFGWLGRH